MIPRFRPIDVGPAPSPAAPSAVAVTTTEIATVQDHDHWNGKLVEIPGIGRRRVLASDRFAHAPPWQAGETVILVVDPSWP